MEFNLSDANFYNNLILAFTAIQADNVDPDFDFQVFYCDNTFDEYAVTWNTNSFVCNDTPLLDVTTDNFTVPMQGNYSINPLMALVAADSDKIFTLKFNITPAHVFIGATIGAMTKESINTPQLFAYNNIASTCVPNWVAQDGICQINDTMFRTYLDSNNCESTLGLPLDNGTDVPCNYCSEVLEKNYTSACYAFNDSGLINYTWEDDNYFGCCVITNITSDCEILYSPYNESALDPCIFTFTDFELDVDSTVYYGLTGDKIFGKIWLNDTANNYSCISYVKTAEGATIQTNPTYSQFTNGVLNRQQEDRQFFFPSNGIASVYWTKENIVVDGRTYVFGVECAGNGQKKAAEHAVTVLYKPINEPITRFFWLQNQWLAIIMVAIFVVLVVTIISVIWFKVRN
jgi:hypothetical protein